MSTAPQVAEVKRTRKTAPTPRVFREFGVPDNLGEFREPQIYYDLDGRQRSKHKGNHESWLDKSRHLRTTPGLAMVKAVPRHGERRSQVEAGVTHEELGAIHGYAHRSSYSRALKKAPDWIRRTRKEFGAPLIYEPGLPEGDRKRAVGEHGKPISPENYVYPSARELAQEAKTRRIAQRLGDVDREPGGRYRWRPEWTLHPNTPGNAYQRLVLGLLNRHRLFEMEPSGRIRGVVQTSPKRLAIEGGLSEATVRRALRFYSDATWSERRHCPACIAPAGKRMWEYRKGSDGELQRDRRGNLRRFLKAPNPDCATCGGKGVLISKRSGIGLIRCIEQPGHFEDGKWKQEPMRIVYLCGGDFDHQRAAIEVQRFLAAIARWRAQRSYELMIRIHAAVLKEYVDTQKHLVGFWRHCRERMTKAGLPEKAIESAFDPHAPP